MPAAPRTLARLLRARAETDGPRGFRFLGPSLAVEDTLTFAALDDDARRIAAKMQNAGVGKGARALLLYPPGLEFVRAFWACVYAGVIAVPVPPPVRARLTRTVARLRSVALDADAHVILTSSDLAHQMPEMRTSAPELAPLTWIATDEREVDAGAWRDPDGSPDDVALLQYTSGSTRDPRGVVITHANLLHNLGMLGAFHAGLPDVVMVHWLPLFHDMGLIRGMLSPLAMGGDCVMMAPMDFAQRPVRWLSAIGAHRATITGAPNFGYELAARAIREDELEGLDLSTLRFAFCSAEPIRKSTLDRFARRFARCGFRADAFRPSYGLAEATVAVCGELGPGAVTHAVSEAALRRGRFEPVGEDRASELVSCGRPLGDQEVVVVDEDGRPSAPGSIGEIWIRGASVGQGYWRNEEETARVFGARLAGGDGPFLRTGDLGVFGPDGGLIVTGRKKDVIIVRGQNFAAHEIEETVEACSPHLRPGGTAAFGVEREGTESVVVASELRDPEGAKESVPAIVAAIVAAVGEAHDLAVRTICFLAPGQLPKTASGKIQRSLCRRLYLERSLETVHVWSAPSRPEEGDDR